MLFLLISWSFPTWVPCILIIEDYQPHLPTSYLLSISLSPSCPPLFSFSSISIIWFDLGLYIHGFSSWISLCLACLIPVHPSVVSLKFTEGSNGYSFSVIRYQILQLSCCHLNKKPKLFFDCLKYDTFFKYILFDLMTFSNLAYEIILILKP